MLKYDTLSVARRLESSGMPRAQAEAFVTLQYKFLTGPRSSVSHEECMVILQPGGFTDEQNAVLIECMQEVYGLASANKSH